MLGRVIAKCVTMVLWYYMSISIVYVIFILENLEKVKKIGGTHTHKHTHSHAQSHTYTHTQMHQATFNIRYNLHN